MQMWPSEQKARDVLRESIQMCIPSNMYHVATTKLQKRNLEKTEWSLRATQNIPTGTFLGFYTGEYTTYSRKSMYAAQVLYNTYIYPFPNEENITSEQRKAKPLANMNEPQKNTNANCCMIVQDFALNEVQQIPDHIVAKNPRFFRGLACFTCTDVKIGEELTWYYGKMYEQNRSEQGYEAGIECELLLNKTVFIPENSKGILKVMPKIAFQCVVPVFGNYKSERFALPKKKRKKSDSSESEESSSSGSGHERKYVPTGSRKSRLENRKRD